MDAAGIAVLCLVGSDGDGAGGVPREHAREERLPPFAWWQGHLVVQGQAGPQALRLLGTPSTAPPVPHDCWKRDGIDDLRFWSVRVLGHGVDAVVPNVQHRGGDAVQLSTRLDPAVFSDIPDDSDSDHESDTQDGTRGAPPGDNKTGGRARLDFVTHTVQVDADAKATIARLFPSLLRDKRTDLSSVVVCIGDMKLRLPGQHA
ncbi:hypothetical protein HK105_203262 [Polyrhizophydium stewartii]|uniref:Uncharacterized protein n=1 Tax=Polyrhizophydium stewartii TaxID=2732419 RepID=A0ABR4NCD8_9FUNG|nr:hypothetical protein HK105_001715 [Polyrhizophydium stewartii]